MFKVVLTIFKASNDIGNLQNDEFWRTEVTEEHTLLQSPERRSFCVQRGHCPKHCSYKIPRFTKINLHPYGDIIPVDERRSRLQPFNMKDSLFYHISEFFQISFEGLFKLTTTNTNSEQFYREKKAWGVCFKLKEKILLIWKQH